MSNRTVVAGRTCVVTGAASGIGRGLALRLASQGCPVAICDWNEEGLEETAGMIDGPVLARKLDVRDRQAQLGFASDVRDWAPQPFGMIVNNAGVDVSQPVAGAALEDDDWVIDVNFWGVINGSRAFLPILTEQGDGAIVNVSSIFGLIGYPSQSAYCAAKFAVRGWTESLRHELRGTRVRAVSIHPGGIDTNIATNARFHSDDLGRTDRSLMEKEFKNVARTSPAKAAATIQTGVEKGKDRILIGPDATALAVLLRFAPVSYYGVLKRLEPLVRRS